jgi:ParB family chromosome partitioning protein
MLHKSSFQVIDIKTIEDTKEWSLHPFLAPEPPVGLLASIQRIGILQPPILLQLSPDKYQLLCGHFRLLSQQIINPSDTQITCLILEEDIPLKQILYTLAEDQLITGNLSSIEKAYFFKYCLNYMELDEISESFLPIIGDKAQVHTIKKLSRLLTLEPELQVSVHDGKISEKTAQEFLSLTSSDRLMLHDIFLDLELGGGKQNRLLTLSKDLAYRVGKTIKELLSSSKYREILLHPEMNKPQKIANLFTVLQKNLFPQSSSAEEGFLKTVHKMDLPAACSITHSQSFERDDVSVTLTFPSLSIVKNHIQAIKKIVA